MADVPQNILRTVLVTGGAGFIGACVARRLSERGHRPHVLVRPASNLWRLADIADQISVHEIDVRNRSQVLDLFEALRPSAVVHLATNGAYADQHSAREMLETNVLGTLNIIEAAEATGVGIIVNAGSSSEYGPKAGPMCEDDIASPDRAYGIAKLAQTHLAALAGRGGSRCVVTLRLFSVYGPWERRDRVVPKIIRHLLDQRPLELSSPDVVRDFIYVEDVSKMLTEFDRLSSRSGETINLGTGVQTSLGEIVRITQELTGSRSDICWNSADKRSWDSSMWLADTAKARSLLGFQPRHDVRAGLSKFINWIQANRDHYEND